MSRRSVVAAVLVAGAMFIAGAVGASANLAWCLADPPVLVSSPNGANLVVNVTATLPHSYTTSKNTLYDTVTAAPDGHGGTLLTVHAYLPAGSYHSTVTAVSYRYNVSATGTGVGGGVVTLYLDVPTS